MARVLMRSGLALVLSALILAAIASGAPAAAPTTWRISHFEVVQAEPWEAGSKVEGSLARIAQMFGFDTMDMVEVKHPLTPETKAEIEAFLHGAAGLMQKWGFPEPNLTDIVERADGRKAYRIYYTNIPDDSGLYDDVNPTNPLVPRLPALFVNADSVMNENGVRPFGYGVLAHELFHAVQDSTPFYRGDLQMNRGNFIATRFDHYPNPWMSEGQADAVGWDIVRILKPAMFRRHGDAFETWGARDYSDELVVEGSGSDTPPTEAYRTASFWRYLAEVNHAKKTPRRYASHPGPEPFPVDYSYLAYFLKRLPMQLENGNDEIDWLDALTRTYPQFRVPLRDYFAEFLAAYAAYGTHRVERTHGKGWKWLNRGFHQEPVEPHPRTGRKSGRTHQPGCWFAGLTPEYRDSRVSFRIARTAGACIELQVAGFEGDLPVTITLKAGNREKLGQLRIGVAGERRTAKTAWIMSDSEASRTRHDFRVPADDVTRFVVSNMASKPSETVDQEAEVVFVVSGVEMGNVPPPSGSGDAEQPAADPDPEKAARKRMATAAPGVSLKGPYTAAVKRREDRDEMTISLGAVPEAAQVLGEVNISGLSALGRMNPGQHIVWNEARKRQGEIMGATAAVARGDQVRLKIPRIDYGFTGTFDHARIRLVRGGNPMAALVADPAAYAGLRQGEGQDLHALDLQSCEPNGHVTIDEYTPDLLRGSFSGQLVEKYRRTEHGLSAACEPPLTVVRNISGRFWVATPWLLDDRYEGPEPVDTLVEDFAADWMEQMGIMIPAMEARLPEESGPPPSPGSPPNPGPGTGAGGAAVIEQCDCSCAGYEKVKALERRARETGFVATARDQAISMCAMQCMAQYAACAK